MTKVLPHGISTSSNRPLRTRRRSGNMVLTSGQIPVNPATGEVSADIAEQARQSLDNVKAVVEASGLKVTDIVKMTVFVKDLNDFAPLTTCTANFSTSTK